MFINLSPVRTDNTVVYEKLGDTITVDGEAFDFSPVGEGDTLPLGAIHSNWFGGNVERVGGELVLTLILPLPENYSQQQAFPTPLKDVQDGPLSPLLPKPLHFTMYMEGGEDE